MDKDLSRQNEGKISRLSPENLRLLYFFFLIS